MRTVLRGLGIVLLGLFAAGAILYLLILPPAPLGVPERGATLANVTLIEPGITRVPNQTLVIEGDRIAEIRPASAEERASSPGARYALPGLIDMHVHFPPLQGLGQTEHFALLMLLHGVTTVRDAGDVQGTATGPARDGIADGFFPGPRVFACGPFVDGPGARWPNSREVATAEQGAAAVDAIADEGFDCIKAYDDLSIDALRGIRGAATRRGLSVIGHTPYAAAFEDGLLDDVQHLTGVVSVPGVRMPEIQKHWADVSESRLDTVVRAAVEHDTAVTPTLVTSDRIAHYAAPEPLTSWAPDALLVPRLYREIVWARPPWPYDVLRAFGAGFDKRAHLLRRLHAAGVRIHLGTDTLAVVVVPGSGFHREMRLFERAGFTPEQTWAFATHGAGSFLGPADRGRLRPGAPADVLVYTADPTRDLGALDALAQVVADGRPYRTSDLRRQLDRSLAHFDGRVFDGLSVSVTRWVVSRVVREPAKPD